MMAQAKRIYILMIEINKLIFFFTSWYFLKEIENMFSVLLSTWSYRNSHESLGELEKAVKTLTSVWLVFPQHFLFSQTSSHVYITRKNHGTCFLFLNCSNWQSKWWGDAGLAQRSCYSNIGLAFLPSPNFSRGFLSGVFKTCPGWK